MSGICGVVHLDGAPASPGEAGSMSAVQAHRGTRAGVHAAGPVSIAATLHDTTAESLRERQPLCEGNRWWLVADARIDNRDELSALLGRRESPSPTDADLILAAYVRWGKEAPARLVGDFAFAIWDAQDRTLFCARDALGVRPLCYTHQPGRVFAFASEIKALFALPHVPRRVDEIRLISYLDGRDAAHDETSFEDVLRLPPGHHLTVGAGAPRVERYWQLDPQREVRLSRTEDYVEGFLAAFDEAVKARMRSIQPVGTMLSGGLDSSAVTSAAHTLSQGAPLPTYSFRFDHAPASDERRFQDLVTSAGGYDPHVVRGDTLDPFVDFDRILFHADEPTGAGNLYLNWAAWLKASEEGIGVILDGFFGDSTISYGDDRLAELIRHGRVWTWAREIRAQRAVEGGGRRMVLALVSSSLRPQLPHWLLAGTRQGVDSHPAPVFVPLVPTASGRLPARAPATDDVGFHSVRRRQMEDIAHEAYTPLFEVMNKASAGAGVDVRFPFADRRLLEYCVALPSSMKQRDGWDRWVLRAGLEGRVPEPVRWRVGKADLLPSLARGLRTTGRARLAAELEDPDGPLARFVDRVALNDLLRRLDAGDNDPVAALWTAACASAWLRAQSAAPPAVSQTSSPPPGPRAEA